MTTNDRVDLSKPCGHITADVPRHVHRPTGGCKECLALGSTWVHLRICLKCGHVGCCDESPNRHASAHYHSTRHPLMTSGEPEETWAFCYADNQFLSEG